MIQIINLKDNGEIGVSFANHKPNYTDDIQTVGNIQIITKKNFILPEDIPRLIESIKEKSHLINPTNKNAESNWKTLVTYLPKDNGWVDDLIAPSIKYHFTNLNASALLQWKSLLSKIGLNIVANKLDNKIEGVNEAIKIDVEEIDHDILEKSREQFNTLKDKNKKSQALTELTLTPFITSIISSKLGQKYNVYKMIESGNFKISEFEIFLHEGILTILQKYGFSKVGLENQQPLDISVKNIYSKSALSKFLKAPSAPVKKVTKKGVEEKTSNPKLDILFDLENFSKINDIYSKEISIEEKKHIELEEKKKLNTNIEDSKKKFVPFALILKNIADINISINNNKPIPEVNYSRIAEWISYYLLEKGEYSERVLDRNRLSKTTVNTEPDKWQKEMILAMKNGESILAITPTSAGKTFTALSGLEWILSSKLENERSFVCCVVAPTVDLALQSYNNIKLTFPLSIVSFISTKYSVIHPDTQVWVGTPVELWVYMDSFKIKYDMGVFDEVHTLSTSFGSGEDSNIISEAIGKLMTLCRKNLVCLSATINDNDIPILQNFIKTQGKLDNIRLIGKGFDENGVSKEIKRPVPQESFQWDGQKSVPMNESSEFIPTTVTPQETFRFLQSLVEQDKAPALIFDTNPVECYNNFIDYVDWVSETESKNYKYWYQLKSSEAIEVASFNYDISSIHSEYSLALLNSKAAEKMLGRVKKQVEVRSKKIDSIMIKIASYIHQSISNPSYSDYKRPFEQDSEDIIKSKKEKNKEENIHNDMKIFKRTLSFVRNPANVKVGDLVPVEVRDLLHNFQSYYESSTANINTNSASCLDSIPLVADSIGSYFRIGQKNRDIDDIRSMFNPSLSSGNKAGRNEMLSLCEAERIRESDIKPLFEIITRGLDFGIGFISPTTPFVVHYNMLKLLNKKLIPVIFTSQDMNVFFFILFFFTLNNIFRILFERSFIIRIRRI